MSSNMVIVFQRGDEEPQAFPLGKPGGDISIAWGEPTRRAAIWKVRRQPQRQRLRNGAQDWQLPQGEPASVEDLALRVGRTRCGVEPDGPVVRRGDGRPGDRPVGPAAALPGGTLTIGYTIFTTGEDVRRYGQANRQQIHLRHALPVAAFAMNTGEALLVTATRRAIKPEEKEQLRVVRGRLALARPTLVATMPDTAEPRALLHGSNDSGGRHVFDFAL
jgi:hypothetical protein